MESDLLPRSRSPRSRSGSPVITNNTVLQSYQPRETKFIEEDGPRRSAAGLSHGPEARPVAVQQDTAIPEIPLGASPETRASKESRVAYSLPIELHADGKIVHVESSLTNSGIIGTIRSVSYGTWEGRSACLIAMRYFFRFSEGNRFKSTEIIITFESLSKVKSRSAPIVRNFSPRKVYGIKTNEDKQWHYDVGIECAVPSGPVSITPSTSAGMESSFTREHHMEIIGKPWSTKDHTDFNQVIWTAHETKTQKHGIPDELNLAVVVEHDSPFQAFVEAEGKMAHSMTLRAWPWDRRNPLLFDRSTSIGKPPSRTEFEKLSAEQWRVLAPYTGEFEDVVTLEQARARLNQAENQPDLSLSISEISTVE